MNEATKEIGITLQPNMLVKNADMRQSTLHLTSLEGSVTANSDFSNCQFIDVKMENNIFAGVSMEGSSMRYCSLNNVIIESSEFEGLIINGYNISEIIRGMEQLQ
ncbi:pentapeptide repeat-containing protein [Paenibacillus glucanolyticus]|uniref:pentapeptide repeat-containing protein n=1 Tax=Paenibacillus glucanolyticus TaxID=59843 RepID=UPI0034CE95D9